MKSVRIFIIGIILLAVTMPADAAEISLGLGAEYGPSEYKGVDNKFGGMFGYEGPIPLIEIDSEYFFLSFPEGAGVHIFKNDYATLDVMIGVIGGFDPDDSDDWAIKQLDKRDSTMFTGVRGSINTPAGIFRASFKGDVLGNSDSLLAEISYKYPINITDKFTITPSAGVLWANDKHNDYYYGVSGSESADSGLRRYKADSSFTPTAKLMLSYQFTDNISAALSGSYSILPGEVKDSPMVDRSHLWSAGFGILYKF